MTSRWVARSSAGETVIAIESNDLTLTGAGQQIRHRLAAGALSAARLGMVGCGTNGTIIYLHLGDGKLVSFACRALLPADRYLGEFERSADLEVCSGDATELLNRLKPYITPRDPSHPVCDETYVIDLPHNRRIHWAVFAGLAFSPFFVFALSSMLPQWAVVEALRSIALGVAFVTLTALMVRMAPGVVPTRKWLFLTGNTVAFKGASGPQQVITAQASELEVFAGSFQWERRNWPTNPVIQLRFPHHDVELIIGASVDGKTAEQWWGRSRPDVGHGLPDHVIGDIELALLADTLGLPRMK